MLSIHTIDKSLQAKDYDRLLRDLGRNGLVMPLPLRVQLAETAAGARGLALRRVIELTYGPTALTRQLIHDLLRAQNPDGYLPDAAGRPSCLLTAAFASGLGRALRDHRERLGEMLEPVTAAFEHALASLSAMQDADALWTGPQDRSERDRLLTSAFIAYLLNDTTGFPEHCRGYALLSALEERQDDAGPASDQLIGMTQLARHTTCPAPMQPKASEELASLAV